MASALGTYIFGAGTPDTYESLKQKRLTAARLQQGATTAPRNIGEGLTALGQAIGYRRLMNNINTGEAAGQAAYGDKRNSALASLFGGAVAGGQGGAMPAYDTGPATPSAFTTPNPAGLPDSVISAVDRVDPPAPAEFAKIERAYNLPEGYLARVAQVESGGNPNAKNPNSSAEGMFQFIDSTAKQYGLTDKTDVRAAADAAARLAADNAKVLRQVLGREPTAGELYLAHQQGAGGAASLLSNPNASASSVLSADALRLNGGSPDMTSAQFAQKWTGKIDGSNPGASIPVLTDLLNDPYATDGDRAVLGMLLEQQMQAMQPEDPMAAIELQIKQAELDQLRNPQPANGTEYGLQPIIGTDANGNPVVMQLGKNGTAVLTDIPDGVTPDMGALAYDRARGAAAGKAVGEATGALPQATATANLVSEQIQSLKDDPYLPNMLGPVDSRLPNVSEGAARVQAKMDQLQGGAFLQARTLLKGGGQITDFEGKKAEEAFVRMNAAQSVEDYKKALDDFDAAVKQGIAKLEQQAGKLPDVPSNELSDEDLFKQYGIGP